MYNENIYETYPVNYSIEKYHNRINFIYVKTALFGGWGGGGNCAPTSVVYKARFHCACHMSNA